nr:NAD(P)H-binding protein [Amycolatopsis tolypomycina]
MQVTVLGATGRTGLHVVRLLAVRGHSVRAGLRSRHRAELLRGLPVEPVLADVTADPGDPGTSSSPRSSPTRPTRVTGSCGRSCSPSRSPTASCGSPR